MKSYFSHSIKIILALAALTYLVVLVDLDAIWEATRNARVEWVVLGVMLLPVNLAMAGMGWYVLIRTVIPTVTWSDIFGSLCCGYALGLFTPARIGQLAGRAYYFTYPDKWELSGLVFIQLFFSLIAAINFGTTAWFFAGGSLVSLSDLLTNIVSYGGITLACLITLIGILPQKTHGVLFRLIPISRVRSRIDFLNRLSTRRALILLLIAGGHYLVYTTQFLAFFRAFAGKIPLLTSYLGVFLVYFIKHLIPSITWTDLGIREGAAVFIFGAMDLPRAAAFNAALMIYMTNLLVPALIGIPFIFRLKLNRKK